MPQRIPFGTTTIKSSPFSQSQSQSQNPKLPHGGGLGMSRLGALIN